MSRTRPERSSKPRARRSETHGRLVRRRAGRLLRNHPLHRAGNPDAAERIADTIDRVVAGLGDMATGRPGRVTGTYEKVVPGLPYIVAYELIDQPGGGRVAILHVIHGARDWPDEGWPG